MKTKFLQLDNAFSENWDEMSPANTGRFCDLCSKRLLILPNRAKHGLYILADKPIN